MKTISQSKIGRDLASLEGDVPECNPSIIERILRFDPSILGKSRKTLRDPVKIEKPNVELFDDPQP